MQNLISDRFLKQFFGSRMDRYRVNLASEAMALPANETHKPDEPGYAPDMDATLENEQTGEVNRCTVPENESPPGRY
jgi:hypothetical protein